MASIADVVKKQFADCILNEVRAEPKDVNYNLSASIIVSNSERVKVIQVPHYTIHKDFVTNFMDEISVTLLLSGDDYAYRVLPYKDDLDVVIYFNPTIEGTADFSKTNPGYCIKYKAYLTNPPVGGLGGGKTLRPEMSLAEVTFQLLPEKSMDLKGKKFAGLLTQTKPLDAVNLILNGATEDCEGIQYTKSDNETKRQIIIPQDTYLKDIPHLLQEKYGIYNNGIGSYYYNKHWFIYPLFDKQRYEKEEIKLTISAVDKRYTLSEGYRTYSVFAGNLSIVVNEDITVDDNQLSDQLNLGTAFATIKPQEIISTNQKTVKTNEVMIDGSSAYSMVSTTSNKHQYHDVKFINQPTSNTHKLHSSVSGNNGTYYTFKWYAANPNLLYPGMPVKFMHADNNGEVIVRYGTLHEVFSDTAVQGSPALPRPSYTVAMLKIFINND